MKQAVLPPTTYRADIDGLRSIAVLAVVLFHFQLANFFEAGFVGVDMFFVISGFLIISNISKRLDAGSFRFASFYTARIRRLAPALVATTILTLAAGLVILTPGELIGLAKETAAAQLYVSNIFYWRTLNYFGLQADQSFLLHTWSLAIEEQFYLVFPVLLWLFARRRTSLLIGILALSFGLNLVMVHLKPEATFYLLPTRAWEFAAGALVPVQGAWLSRIRVSANMAAVSGLVLIAAAFWVFDSTIAFPGSFAVLPVVGTMLLLTAGADSASWYSKAISSTVPVSIGRVSYELYLVHWPVRVFAPLLFLEYSLGVRLCALAVCFVLAVVIYHVVERPIRAKQTLAADSRLVAAYTLSGVALLGMVGGLALLQGLPGRLSPAAQRLAAASGDEDTEFRQCEGRVTCTIGAPKREPTWLVFGDSHAEALGASFSIYLRKEGKAGLLAFQSGCLPVSRTGDAGCRTFNVGVRSFLSSHPEIKTVVLVSTWRQPLEARYTDETGHFARGADALVSFKQSLDRDLVSFNGKRVILWFPVPGARRPVPNSLARNLMLGVRWDLTFSRSTYDATFGFLDEVLAAHPTVEIIRPADTLCRERCAVLAAGRPVYHDDAHPAWSQAGLFEEIIRRGLEKHRLPLTQNVDSSR